jgi:hypothetical protein
MFTDYVYYRSILKGKRLSIVAFLSKHTRTRFRARATVVLFSVSLQAVLFCFHCSSIEEYIEFQQLTKVLHIVAVPTKHTKVLKISYGN